MGSKKAKKAIKTESLIIKSAPLHEDNEKIAALEATVAAYESKMIEMQRLIDKERSKSSALESDIATQTKNVNIVKRKLRESEERLEKAKKTQLRLQETISFQLGYTLTHAHTSFRSFIKLPIDLWHISRDASARRKSKKNTQTHVSRDDSLQSASAEFTAKVRSSRPPTLKALEERLRMAVIMDPFTYNAYSPEADILQLHPENWKKQLSTFKADIIFIESAWDGLDGLWKTKVSSASAELRQLLSRAHDLGIPSIFWNKEDPSHYGTFLETARLVDYVFTTDADCIPYYKKDLGHDNVFLLPFAAQPTLHNPIEKYDRKKAFNFAGSYYLRYPERQRDFEALINAAQPFLSVEIHDRNFEKKHPHYIFPDKYIPMILGSLCPDEIDRAYKGYEFGININTIKYSQTMFARRAFELLASNTSVISNYSHGQRLLLGDLIISSDNEEELGKNIKIWLGDELYRRKLRLLGLRKVMLEHTYRHRLDYICERLGGKLIRRAKQIYLLAAPQNVGELSAVLSNFNRQVYHDKSLILLTSLSVEGKNVENIQSFRQHTQLGKFIEKMPENNLFGVLHAQDYYGPQYLTDLALAFDYSEAEVCGKKAFYELFNETTLTLNDDGGQYRFASSLPARSSLARWSILKSNGQELAKSDLASLTFESSKSLALDEFNYIKNGVMLAPDKACPATDLLLTNPGVPLGQLGESILLLPNDPLQVPCESSGIIRLKAGDLYAHLEKTSLSGKVRCELENDFLLLRSTLEPDKFKYLYLPEPFSRNELNLESNSQFKLTGKGLKGVATVFVYLDENGDKLGHTIQPAGGQMNTLPIPASCTHIQLGFKVTGPGRLFIKHLDFGVTPLAASALLCSSPYLVLAKQYPSYNDIYRYGFLHCRVKAYKANGLMASVFRLCQSLPPRPYHEFEGIEVAAGTLEQLENTLKLGHIRHVLVHMLDRKMWATLRPFLDNIKVTVWVHGAEIQSWERRAFEFERLDRGEIDRQKRLSAQRIAMWRDIFKDMHPNLTVVFVSNTFKNQSFEDLGIQAPDKQVEVIHNYIDNTIFNYKEKTADDRLRILSIRSYSSNKYANDLTVKTILELSNRPFFRELFFHLVGDGELFEELTAPIKGFENVKLDKMFLPQWKISELQNDYGIFLTPTRWDSQGVSRDEAMSSGLVAITNKIDAIPEFVDDSCAITVPAEDYVAMADAIEELYNKPDLFLQLSRAAAERVRRQSGFDQTIQREIEMIMGPSSVQPVAAH